MVKLKKKQVELVYPSDREMRKMLDSVGKAIAHPYLVEEQYFLKNYLSKQDFIPGTTLVVVGCGDFWHLPLAEQHDLDYLGIDPNGSSSSPLSAHFLQLPFEELHSAHLISESQIFFFMFNVISHIREPISHLSRVLNGGDHVLISGWNHTAEAQELRDDYFKYVYEQAGGLSQPGPLDCPVLSQDISDRIPRVDSFERQTGDYVEFLTFQIPS